MRVPQVNEHPEKFGLIADRIMEIDDQLRSNELNIAKLLTQLDNNLSAAVDGWLAGKDQINLIKKLLTRIAARLNEQTSFQS